METRARLGSATSSGDSIPPTRNRLRGAEVFVAGRAGLTVHAPATDVPVYIGRDEVHHGRHLVAHVPASKGAVVARARVARLVSTSEWARLRATSDAYALPSGRPGLWALLAPASLDFLLSLIEMPNSGCRASVRLVYKMPLSVGPA